MVEFVLIICMLVAAAAGYWLVVRPMGQMQQFVGNLEQAQSDLRDELAQSLQEMQVALSQMQAIQKQSHHTLFQSSLKTQSTVDHLHGFSQATQATLAQVQKETVALSQAFKSPRQQGNWGELDVSSIVE